MEYLYNTRGVGGLPAEICSNGLAPALDANNLDISINANGTNASRPGQVFSFTIPTGPGQGFMKKGSMFIKGKIRVILDSCNGMFQDGPRGIINAGCETFLRPDTLDPPMLHVEPPQFKFHNASHLKRRQRLTVDGLSIYDESDKNVFIEAITSLSGSTYDDRKYQYMNTRRKMPKLSTNPTFTKSDYNVNYNEYEWEFTMDPDCNILNNATADFPLFRVGACLMYEVTLDDVMARIFDFRTAQVERFEITELTMKYKTIILSPQVESALASQPYELPFTTTFSGYQSYPSNGSTDTRMTPSMEYLNAMLCFGYTIPKVTGIGKAPLLRCSARNLDHSYDYVTQGNVLLKHVESMQRGAAKGLGVYGSLTTMPDSFSISIDGLPFLPTPLRPRESYGECVRHLNTFIKSHLSRDHTLRGMSDHPLDYDGILGPDNFDINIGLDKSYTSNTIINPSVCITNVLALDTRFFADRDMKNMGRVTRNNVTIHLTVPSPEENAERTVVTQFKGDDANISAPEIEVTRNILGTVTNNNVFQSFSSSNKTTASIKIACDKYLYYYALHERTLNFIGTTVSLSPI